MDVRRFDGGHGCLNTDDLVLAPLAPEIEMAAVRRLLPAEAHSSARWRRSAPGKRQPTLALVRSTEEFGH